jgi:hypothetical protein
MSEDRVDGLLAAIRETLRDELRTVLAERPGDVLDVRGVMARYGLADPRAARAVMAEAGGFKLAGRRLVHRDALERYERLRVERPTPAVKPGRRRSTGDDREPEPLRSGFWQE